MRLRDSIRPTKKLVYGLLAIICLLSGGQAVAVAGTGDGTHPRGGAESAAEIAGQSTGGGCAMGYDTESSTITPPDDSTTDNAPIGVVTFKKACVGAVIGLFVGEVSTSGAGDYLHADMRATCTGTGGLASPCAVGSVVFASPGHTFVQSSGAAGTRSVMMAWTGLKKGIWKFEVLPGGNNHATVQFRTFRVEAFAGG